MKSAIVLVLVGLTMPISATFNLSNTLGDGMVLQREPQSAVVYGMGDTAGEALTITFQGKELKTEVCLDTLHPHSHPREHLHPHPHLIEPYAIHETAHICVDTLALIPIVTPVYIIPVLSVTINMHTHPHAPIGSISPNPTLFSMCIRLAPMAFGDKHCQRNLPLKRQPPLPSKPINLGARWR